MQFNAIQYKKKKFSKLILKYFLPRKIKVLRQTLIFRCVKVTNGYHVVEEERKTKIPKET